MREVVGILVLAVALGGCVRADPPTSYRCTSSSECPAGETCAGGDCLARGQCIGPGNCTNGQVCKSGGCIDPECDDAHPNACNGFKCVAGICATTCDYSDSCASADYECDFLSHRCKVREKYTGEACKTSVECLSGSCCGPAGAMVCGLCSSLGSYCTKGAGDCASGYCCPGGFIGNACAASPCP
jgi:hypothetical protein